MKLITPAELAELLQVAPNQVYQWNSQGALHPVYIGRLARYTESEVQRILREGLPTRERSRVKA